MTYKSTLDYLYQRLPMFHRVGAAAYKANLDNTIEICKLLKNPQRKFKSIHIAGTNGKGSSSHMLAACFQKAGYKTGLYTSPHLKDFRERIRINGKMIGCATVTSFVKKYKNEFEKIQPSFFEWTVGLAFHYFAEEKVDIAIIEVGLGGRLDSTNIIQPIASLITNIGMDHTNLLGNTLKKIAAEKAGIIKAACPVVVSQFQGEVATVFKKKAIEEKTSLLFANKEYELVAHTWDKDFLHCLVQHKISKDIEAYKLDLTGSYQLKNLLGVLSTLDIARKKGYKKLTKPVVRAALGQVKKLNKLMGRWQILSKSPLIVADTGHNVDGIKEVVKNIERQHYRKLHLVIGMVNDKDIKEVLDLLPAQAAYYFTKANIPRAMNEKELQQLAKQQGLSGKAFPTVKEAITAAKNKATEQDLIFIGGSTFVVAEAV